MADERGLFLLIHPNGSKYWRLKYRLHGKEKLKALGVYPEVSLAEARDRREQDRKLLASGIDPMSHKKETQRKAKINASNTFEATALEWYGIKEEGWSRSWKKHVSDFLKNDVFPTIGNRPIAEISAPELLECLKKIEKRGALDTLGKTRGICGEVFRYGIQTGRCERDVAADLKGAFKTRRTEHYRKMETHRIPDFIAALEKNEARLFASTRRAIWLSMLTFQRPGEIISAQWSEIDWQANRWLIPADKKKERRAHIVPLSSKAISILKEQQEEVRLLNLKTDYVFPSPIRPAKPLSNATVNKAIKSLGFGEEQNAHGFRSLARTVLAEELKWNPEVIEKQLGHKTKNPLGEAYDRTQFLDDRKILMQAWADYLDKAASEEKVIVTEFRKTG